MTVKLIVPVVEARPFKFTLENRMCEHINNNYKCIIIIFSNSIIYKHNMLYLQEHYSNIKLVKQLHKEIVVGTVDK